MTASEEPGLKKSLSTLQLWGIAVGLVISGEYFGWSYGWASRGHAGLSRHVRVRRPDVHDLHLQLHRADDGDPACRRPVRVQPARLRAAGRLRRRLRDADRVRVRAAGDRAGDRRLPQRAVPGARPEDWRRVGAYVVFMALNIVGVQIAATFELVVTLLAIFELLVFMGVVAPGFSLANFMQGGWAGQRRVRRARRCPACSRRSRSRSGSSWPSRASAMAAEEAKDAEALDPDRLHRRHPDAGGAGRRRDAVRGRRGRLDASSSNINDPLPQAMKVIVGESSGWLHMLVWLGLFGLIASFHGIILGYSRQIFALARAGYLPAVLGARAPALPHAAPGDPGGRRGRHRGDLQRRAGSRSAARR